MRSIAAVLALALLVPSCRPGPSAGGSRPAGGGFTGCFESDPKDIYQSGTLCLGPPEAPPGRFWLDTKQAVPDATLRDRCEGGYQMAPGAVVLHVQHCQHQGTSEQTGSQHSSGSAERYQLRAVLGSADHLQLTMRRGGQLQLRRTR